MLFEERVGVGIVTYNREFTLKKLINSLPLELIDVVVIVNDGTAIDETQLRGITLINNKVNIGVGRSKNKALKYLIQKKIDHFFIIEDDIFVKDRMVFEKYIEASRVSGIQHFNFGLHGTLNLNENRSPKIKISLNFNKINICFYDHCVGAFSYFSKLVIDKVGLYDERYYNALEHLDHTYLICQQNFHPSYWYFADIENSNCYLGDEYWSSQQSVISANNDAKKNLLSAELVFSTKYHFSVYKINKDNVLDFFKNVYFINMEYGQKLNLLSLNKNNIYSYLFKDIEKNLKKLNFSRLLKSFLILLVFIFNLKNIS